MSIIIISVDMLLDKHCLPSYSGITNFVHFSDKPLVKDDLEHQRQAICEDKPVGLWISDESADISWSAWCSDENFPLRKIAHKIELDLTYPLLELSSYNSIVDFNNKYAAAFPWSQTGELRAINWYAVAQEYDGILITPYQWQARHEFFWYYGWDCASGCIWNPRLIKSIEVMSHG